MQEKNVKKEKKIERLSILVNMTSKNAVDFARKYRLAQSSVSRWLNGEVSFNSAKISVATGCSFIWLENGVGEPFPPEHAMYNKSNYDKSNYDKSNYDKDPEPTHVSEPVVNYVSQIKVYDLPVHANVGTAASVNHLSYSYKPLEVGFDLKSDSVMALRVVGDSMRDVGIYPNSIVIFDTSYKPSHGSDIIANHDGMIIVKHVEFEDGKMRLYSRNNGKHEYEVCEQSTFTILGVVKLVINIR